MSNQKIDKYLKEGDYSIGNGSYSVESVECVNILIVGRTQAGKTTLINTLLNASNVSSKTAYSCTKEPNIHKLIVRKTIGSESKSFQLNIIDTPGLKDVRSPGEKAMTNEEVMNLASIFLKDNIARLNMVAMVSRAGETHHDDIEVFRDIIEFLGPEFSAISMLILTHCDGFTDNKISEFENAIMRHEQTKEVYEFCQLKLWRFGAINIDLVDSLNNPELGRHFILNKLQLIAEFRDKFLDKIIELANNGVHVSKLDRLKCDFDRLLKEAMREGYNRARTEEENRRKSEANKTQNKTPAKNPKDCLIQ